MVAGRCCYGLRCLPPSSEFNNAAVINASFGGALTDVFAVRMEGLSGCWREAQRADRVAEGLLRTRTILDLEFYDQISAILREVESTSRLLRDLHDLFPIYRSRVPIIFYYLHVILPSLVRTLKEMKFYLDNDNLPARTQWTLMSNRLNEQGGITLAARFALFVEFLVQLVRLLSRCGKECVR